MPAKKVAEHFGVTRQAISWRLKDAGVQTRPLRPKPPRFAKEILESLYVEQQLTVDQVADRLNTSPCVIIRELDKHGIQRRTPKTWAVKYPQIRDLKIGESIDLPKSNRLKHAIL